jgi:hypothetical protein
MKRATAASMLQLRVGTVAFMTREGSIRAFAAESTNDCPWHIADVRRLPDLGPLTGALPTFGAECRVWMAPALQALFQ